MVTAGTANLKIIRRGGYADCLRSYKIFVNGELAGTIARNAVLNVAVPSGPLKVQAHIDWGRSEPLIVETAAGQTIEVEVSNHWGAWLSLWALSVGFRSYLTLKRT